MVSGRQPVQVDLARACEGAGPAQAVRLVQQLLQAAGCPDAAFDARELYRLAVGEDARLRTVPLTPGEARSLAALAERRAGRWPLQYLAGLWPFLDFEVQVGPGVLIPRQDTEVLCEQAAACLRGLAAPRVLDLCAGSGCVGLGVKRLCPAAQVDALEKSPEAFAYLKKNARAALPDQPGAVRPVLGDVFGYEKSLRPASLDMVVANPPYRTGAEMAVLQPEVACAPALALDGGPDGLAFYRHIAAAYRPAVRPGGWLALEIGWQQGGEVCALLQKNGWTGVRCVQDLAGNDRVVLGQNPGQKT